MVTPLLAALSGSESFAGAVVAVAVAGLGVFQALRTTKIRAVTDDRINAATKDAAVAVNKADNVQRLIDQLQEQLISVSGLERDLRTELLTCRRENADLIVGLAEAKSRTLLVEAEAKSDRAALRGQIVELQARLLLLEQGTP